MTELMGSETYLYLSVNGVEGNMVARVDPRSRTAAGQRVKIAADPARLYMFDAKTGENILFYE